MVERAQNKIVWIPGKFGKRIPISTSYDFFGLFDLIAYAPGYVRLIQVTSHEQRSTRVRKIIESKFWLADVEVWARQRGKKQFQIAYGKEGFEWKEKNVLSVIRKSSSSPSLTVS
jgi:hypothetical protein